MSAQIDFLTTKQLPAITGFSTSYFEKVVSWGAVRASFLPKLAVAPERFYIAALMLRIGCPA